MAKPKSQFVCQACGSIHTKWQGRCEGCGEWNTIEEEAAPEAQPKTASGGRGGRKLDFVRLRGEATTPPRRKTHIGELDRVCGGGLVPAPPCWWEAIRE